MEYNKEKIANGFCMAFTTCAEKLCSLCIPSIFTWQNDGDIEHAKVYFSFKHVKKQNVPRNLLNPSSNKASGHDDIPARLLNDVSYELTS